MKSGCIGRVEKLRRSPVLSPLPSRLRCVSAPLTFYNPFHSQHVKSFTRGNKFPCELTYINIFASLSEIDSTQKSSLTDPILRWCKMRDEKQDFFDHKSDAKNLTQFSMN